MYKPQDKMQHKISMILVIGLLSLIRYVLSNRFPSTFSMS